MIDFGILKASGLKYFIQCFDKNFTPSQEKKENKVVVSAKTSIPAKELGHINIKGIFSLFKSSERFISPILSLEHENYFQINYNLLKNSASMNINFSKENAFIKSLNYQITPDKFNCKLNQNKINFSFKNNSKIALNYDSNEKFIHYSNKFKDWGRVKYKYSNKGKNNIQIMLNRNIYGNYISYFNNIEFYLNQLSFSNKNLHGLLFNYALNPSFSINALCGFGKNMTSYGFFSRQNITNYIKFENCFLINNSEITKFYSGYVASLSYKNFVNCKVKLQKNEIKTAFMANFKNFSISTNLNWDSNVQNNNKSGFKYAINMNFKW